MANYDSQYYEDNLQSGDRPALDFYYRFFKRVIGGGSRNRKILEYGSGMGHLTKRLSQDFDCYALDISDYALSQVNINAPKATTIESMDELKSRSLEGVFALHVMEHIADPVPTVKIFHKKLKTDGLLVVVVPNPGGLGQRLKKNQWFGYSDKTHCSLFSEEKWRQIISDGGFDRIKIRGDGMWDVPYLPHVPEVIQKLIFYPAAGVQYLLGRVYLPTYLGECLIIVARKP